MTDKKQADKKKSNQELQLATFYVGDLLLGIEIERVQEINRHLDTTYVPYAPECVRGVVNLRGEVVTVLDLRAILGLPAAATSNRSRNLIVSHQGELIGMIVDRISDILTIPVRKIESAPANVNGIEGKYFRGVHMMDNEILILLELEQAIEESSQVVPG